MNDDFKFAFKCAGGVLLFVGYALLTGTWGVSLLAAVAGCAGSLWLIRWGFRQDRLERFEREAADADLDRELAELLEREH